MIVYWGMLIWVFFLGYTRSEEHNPLKSDNAIPYTETWKFALMLMLPIIFFAAVRGKIMDTTAYIRMFNDTPIGLETIQEYVDGQGGSGFFYGCQVIFKTLISKDPTAWIAFIAVIEGLLITKFFQRYSPNVAVTVYIFMASTQFNWMYNGIRQFLAVAILCAASEWVVKNRWYLYVPLALFLGGLGPIYELFGAESVPWFLGGVHQSALLMIPVFFIIQGKAWNWKMIVFILVFAVLAVTNNIEPLIGDVAAESEYAGDMQEAEELGDDGSHPLRAVVPMVPVIMAWLKRKEIADMGDEVPPIINISINAAVITVALYICGTITSGILIGRLPIYTELYNMILIPWLILQPYKKNSKLLATAVYGMYFLWFIYQMYIAWGGMGYGSDLLGFYV